MATDDKNLKRKIHQKLLDTLRYDPDSVDAAGLAVMGIAMLMNGEGGLNIFNDVRDFHKRMGVNPPKPLSNEAMLFRLTLINEEHKELITAIAKGDKQGELDACIDLIYVIAGLIAVRGWNGEEAWERVHKANMEKIPAPKPTIRAGKTGQVDVIKPTGWKAPDLSDLV